MQAKLNLRALKAANRAASDRYYLNGVFVEIAARQATYVATDGHILFAYRDELEKETKTAPGAWNRGGESVKVAGDPDNTLTCSIIVPSETIKSIKYKPSCGDCGTLEKTEAGEFFITLPDANRVYFKPIDGTFPDWRCVVPRDAVLDKHDEDARDNSQHNPALLMRLSDAGRELSGAKKGQCGYSSILPRGGSPAIVRYSDENAFGVVMPMRQSAPKRKDAVPSWVHAPIGNAKLSVASIAAE